MVGRAGRSNACFTCRKRRVKCDGVKPHCNRCRDSDFTCDGYPGTSFIDETVRFQQAEGPKSRKGSTPRASSSAASSTALSQASLQSLQGISVLAHNDIPMCYLRNMLQALSPGATLQHGMNNWTGFLALERPNTLAYQCLESLAQANFGRLQGAPEVTARGLVLYGKSLRTLNESLGDFKKMRSIDVSLAVVVLIMFELLVLSNQDGWARHALGLGRLMEVQGPEAFTNKVSLALLEHHRFIIILASLSTSQATFLSRPEWKMIPWKFNPIGKGFMQRFLDIMADLPGLKQELESAKTSPITDLLKHSISERCVELIARLRAWRAIWDTEADSKTSELPLDESASKLSFTTRLIYTSLEAADRTAIFDATLISAINALVESNTPEPTNALPVGTTLADYGRMAHPAAIEICRTVDFQLDETFNMVGKLIVNFPIIMALRALGQTSPVEAQWLQGKLQKLAASSHHWEVTKHLTLPR